VPLLYQPGTHWRYSYGFDILGCVAKKVTGVSPDAWLKQVNTSHTPYSICMT
jgi:CubicO group peptidase (beta-lactamase class C family)